MIPGSWTQWFGQWAGYLLWWFGLWLSQVVLGTIVGWMLLSAFPSVPYWVSPTLAILLVTSLVVTAYRASMRDVWASNLLRSVDQEFAGRIPSCRRRSASTDDPSWAHAFIGMIAGPTLTVLLSAALYWVADRFGYTAPSDAAFAVNLLLGAWLGTFTWVRLGATLRSAPVTTRWFRLSGTVGLAIIAWTAAVYSRGPDGGWSAPHLLGTLFILAVPLCWSILHLILGLAARAGTAGGWNAGGGGPIEPDSEGPDGGAGRPSPRGPYHPVRSLPEAKPYPRTPAAVP